MKDVMRKRLYDETTTLIGRQTMQGVLSAEESRFLLDYLDGIFFGRASAALSPALKAWLSGAARDEECDELIRSRLLDTELKDEFAVAESKLFIEELLEYYQRLEP